MLISTFHVDGGRLRGKSEGKLTGVLAKRVACFIVHREARTRDKGQGETWKTGNVIWRPLLSRGSRGSGRVGSGNLSWIE